MSSVPINRQRLAPLPSELTKKLPSNIEAERSVLGAIVMDNSALAKAAAILASSDFFLDQHARIFRKMLAQQDAQQAIDLVTLTEELERNGELEAAGGAPYLASLGDGLPRAANVEHYARIVKQKATLRELIHTTHAIQQRAFEATEDADTVLSGAESSLKAIAHSQNENPAVVIGFHSLLTRTCPPVEFAIDPLLSKRGTGEIYGWRGTGKSYIATQTAFDISTAQPTLWGGHKGGGGGWPVSRAFRPLYVYGEMDESEIQERALNIARMRRMDVPHDEKFGTLCMDYQKSWRPKICTSRDRKIIEDRLFGYGYEGLFLDNISTLWPTSQENQSDRSAVLAEWFTDLNQRGIWVIFLHHAGKSGEQRGDSEKEDMLSFVLKLRRPANYKPDEQLRVEVHIEKNRHKCRVPKMLMPFEIHLIKNAHGEQEWVTRPAKEAQRIAAFEMFKNNMPPMFAAQEVGVSKATIYRYKKEFDENKDPEFHREPSQD